MTRNYLDIKRGGIFHEEKICSGYDGMYGSSIDSYSSGYNGVRRSSGERTDCICDSRSEWK